MIVARIGSLLAVGLVGASCTSAHAGAGDAGRPTITMPAKLAEGENPEAAKSASPDAAAPKEEPKPPGSLPDPEALSSKVQWEYVFVHDRGQVSVGRVRRLLFEDPLVTPRNVGRYAVELWIGRELIDRVRFDFPMLAADPPPTGRRRPIDEPPRFAPGARVDKTVLVPASARATRAVLLDRATGDTVDLPWPPDQPIEREPAPAGR